MNNFSNTTEEGWSDFAATADAMAFREMQLLERYANLPACDDLVIRQLRREFSPDLVDALLEEEDENAATEDNPHEEETPDDELLASEMDDDMKRLNALGATADLYGRQVAESIHKKINEWGMFQVFLLPKDWLTDGLNVQICLSRALGVLSSSYSALVHHEFNRAIVSGKRVVMLLKMAIKMMTVLQTRQRLIPQDMFSALVDGLKKTLADAELFLRTSIQLRDSEQGF